jgi:hypothetical protein
VCEVCAAQPAVLRPGFLEDLPELAGRLTETSRDPRTWTTFYDCSICGTTWIETHENLGHGELPVLTRVDPDAAASWS